VTGSNNLAVSHAFLYNGVMHDLGTLGGTKSDALGINQKEQVVGVSYISGDSDYHAFLWTALSEMVDLNTLIDPAAGWVLTDATAINDVGQIVGQGYAGGQTRAFLLTPVPEPASWLLLTVAAAGLFALRAASRRAARLRIGLTPMRLRVTIRADARGPLATPGAAIGWLMPYFVAVFCASPSILRADVFDMPAGETSLQFVTVGDVGNAADATGYGAVNYPYQIAKYDVTNAQYAQFLNAKDPAGTNTLGLYNSGKFSGLPTLSGIAFIAANSPGNKYASLAGQENQPVTYVGWFDAIRFVNWLSNGQGNGDTETGSYTLGPLGPGAIPTNPGIARNSGATLYLPSENEWYKSAYYNSATSSYFLYPTSSNVAPAAAIPPGAVNSANYSNVVPHLTDVGAYVSSAGPYGTFDQGGDAFQWTETPAIGRVARGGSFQSIDVSRLASTTRPSNSETRELNDVGFRVAAAVPEPSTLVLFAIGLILVGTSRRVDGRTRH
jgi:probable HAF family extracellular repeat protein